MTRGSDKKKTWHDKIKMETKMEQDKPRHKNKPRRNNMGCFTSWRGIPIPGTRIGSPLNASGLVVWGLGVGVSAIGEDR
jgi:hypothetical protein